MKKMKKYLPILLAAAALTACDHDEIYEPIDFQVTLAPTNTYLVGEPVQFLFSGNADYIVFYSGETGHEYRYRNRYQVDPEDIESCELSMQLSARMGSLPSMTAYATNTFAGLNGADEEADMAAINALLTEEKDLQGWTKLEVEDTAAIGQWNDPVKTDVTELADNFCVALHWDGQTIETSQRGYWVGLNVTVKFRGYDSLTVSSKKLGLIPFSMADGMDSERYTTSDKTSIPGTLYFTSNNPGLNSQEFVLTGSAKYDASNEKTLPYAIDTWIVSTPMALNLIDPDEGVSIKTLSESLASYSYTFEQAGTYTVSFVATSGNYIDQSRDVKEFTVTVIDPLKAE